MTPPVSSLARRVGVATSVVQVVYFLPVALPPLDLLGRRTAKLVEAPGSSQPISGSSLRIASPESKPRSVVTFELGIDCQKDLAEPAAGMRSQNSIRAVPPTAADAQLALESSRRLTQFLAARPKKALRVRIEPENEPEESISIPVTAFRLLNSILTEMAKGNAVTLIPVHAELTTQQAADILNVSRPFLIEQLEKGVIPYRKVGTHRRVMFKDLMEYKQTMDHNRLKALEELSVIDQELGLGY